jgi:phospholipid/cholesterol/gamma-HCH transport system substrate-binding protein
VNLKNLVSGLADDKDALLGSLDSISAPVGRDRRPGQGHPQAVRQRHQGPARRRRQPGQEQGRARPHPPGAADQAREGRPDRRSTAPWFNFYLCQFTGQVTVAGKPLPVDYQTNSDRCSLP